MKHFKQHRFLGRGTGMALAFAMSLSLTMSQSIVVSGTGSFSNTGTIKVKGDINTSAANASVTIGGTVELNGTTQDLGVSGKTLAFTTLNVLGTDTKTMTTNVSVSDALTVNNGGGKFLDVNNKALSIGGTSTLSGGASLDVTDASSTVVFNSGGASQIALGLTYAGALTLSGTSTKNLSANASVAGAFSQTGGALTVDQNLTVSYATPSFATIATVAAGKTLTLSGTGAKDITTVTTTNGTGTIANTGATGVLTIGTLSDNLGSITGGASGLTFTNGATNHGTITGAAGPVTFSSTLAQAGGTITAGGGDIAFNGIVTQTGGSIASAASTDVLDFKANVANTAGTIDLTGSGAAQFAGSVNATGLNFANGTYVTYNGVSAGQVIADVNYGNLTLKNSTKAWTLAADRTINNNLDVQASSATAISGSFNLNVSGNISLASNLTKSANAVVFATNAASTVSGSADILGSVTRTHAFTATNSYTFNNAATIVTPTAFTTLTSMTVSELTPPPTGFQNGNSVNRKYSTSYAGSGLTADVQLGYLSSGDYSGSSANKLKFFHDGIAKANRIAGTYTIGTTGSFNYVKLPALATFAYSEIAMDDRYNIFISKAIAAWDLPGTWDANAVPSSSDDVEIAGGFAVNIPAGVSASANSVLIDNGAAATEGGLTLAATGTLTVGTGGITNNNTTGAGFTTSGTANLNGAVTNAGTFTANGALAVVNATVGFTNSGSLNVNNAGGQVTIAGGNFVNTGTLTNAGTVTVQ
jgi:hypothetical protein